MQQIIARRLEHVPPAYCPLLRLAAIIGRALDLRVLRAAAPETDLDTWLSDLANVAVLAVDEGRWQFAHDNLRIHILISLDEDDRCRLHRHAAEVIESTFETRRVESSDMAAALFHHWTAAGEATRAARYALLAARAALRSGAYARAQVSGASIGTYASNGHSAAYRGAFGTW
jgi:predicted ATPase